MIMNYIRIIRWPNLLIMSALMSCLRYFFILPQFEQAGILSGSTVTLFALLILSVLSIAAGGYVINDMSDEDIDVINHPELMIIGKGISHLSAKKYYLGLTLIGIIIGFYLAYTASNVYFGMIFPVMAILLYYYSKRYKRQLITGNIVVSFASAMVLLVTWNFELFMLDAENSQLSYNLGITTYISTVVYAYSLFAFISSMIREIVKDMEDIAGDEAAFCATIPILFGVSVSKKIVGILVVVLMFMVVYWQYWLWMEGFRFAAVFLIATQLLGIAALFKLISSTYHTDFHWLSGLFKALMISGIASLVLLIF
jgi:4-hydroxybenzoate polyprenyltransferase